MFNLNSNVTRLAILAVVIVLGLGTWWALSPKVLYESSSTKTYSADGSSLPPTPTSPSFTTHGKWKVSYSFSCSSDAGVMFGYAILPNRSDDVMLLDKKSGSATKTYAMNGTHQVQLISSCPYTLKVTEARF